LTRLGDARGTGMDSGMDSGDSEACERGKVIPSQERKAFSAVLQ
jgi:hypothetical protein